MRPANHPGNGAEISLRRRFRSLPTIISFVVAVSLLVFLVARFDVDLGATWKNIRQSNPLWYLLAFLSYYTTFLFRGARWMVLLRNVEGKDGAKSPPSLWTCARLILIGWFVNTVALFRLGDAYRAYAYTEEREASFARTAGTVLAERILDVLLFFGLFVATVVGFFLVGKGSPSTGLLVGAVVMLAAVGMILGAMVVFRARLSRLLPGRLAKAYEHFHQGTMGSFRQLPVVTLLGFLGWLSEVGRLYFIIKAVGLSVSGGLVVFVALANALLTTVPFTPGGVGVVEPGIVGLLMLSMARSEAVAVALLDRSISYLSVVVLGGAVFFLRQASRARSAKVSFP